MWPSRPRSQASVPDPKVAEPAPESPLPGPLPLLVRTELELADGRYLILYGYEPAVGPGA
jgi:hypothetical protein